MTPRFGGRQIISSAVPAVLFFFLPAVSQALPAFARQLNAECATCHYQHFPKLNAFGRGFKIAAYSLISDDPLEGDELSLPPNLNLTFFMRSRYVGGSDTSGSWQIPDEAAILAGGRLAEGMGGMVEWGGPLLSAKTSFTGDVAGISLGTTVFTTDGLGAAYGFELMNTGVVGNLRAFERSARPLIGNNDNLNLANAASGIAFHAAAGDWFGAVTWFIPDSKKSGYSVMDAGGAASYYLRAAWLPSFAGHDAGLGIGKYGGYSRVTTVDDGSGRDAFGNAPGRYKLATDAAFIDAQWQGSLGGHALGAYFLYAVGSDAGDRAGTVNLWSGVARRPASRGLDLELGMTHDWDLLFTTGRFDDGSAGLSAKTLYGLGLYWRIHQNITLQPMLEYIAGDQGVDRNGDAVSRVVVSLETAF